MSTKQLEKLVVRLTHDIATLRASVRNIEKTQKKQERYKPAFVKDVLTISKKSSGTKKFVPGKNFRELIS